MLMSYSVNAVKTLSCSYNIQLRTTTQCYEDAVQSSVVGGEICHFDSCVAMVCHVFSVTVQRVCLEATILSPCSMSVTVVYCQGWM
jgi:hypothetical protein